MDKHVETYERRRLWMMFLAIVLSLIVVNGTVLAVVELGIMGRNPDLNKEKRFGEFKNPYEDINKDTIPFVQKWAITDSVPHANMSDHQVLVYTAFVVWVTVLLSGLGLELFVWIYYLDTWCEQHEALWRFAQLLFPLLLTTTLGLAIQANYLALPVMVVGLWKFGFPETLMYMYLALFASDESWFQRSADLMNAIGLVVHHGALALFMSLLLVSVIPPSRYVVIGSLVLIMQHWFVLVKYANVPVYAVIELALEFWFEWIVISEFQYYRSIFLHFCYLYLH